MKGELQMAGLEEYVGLRLSVGLEGQGAGQKVQIKQKDNPNLRLN